MKTLFLSLSVLLSVNLFGQWKKVKDGPILQCEAFDSKTCYATSSHNLWKTTDGGKNWEEVKGFADSASFGQMAFTSKETGYIYFNEGTKVKLLRTTDAASSWTKIQAFDDMSIPYIHAVDDNVAFFNSGGDISRTLDGCKTFTKFQEFSMGYHRTLFFLDGNNGFLSTRDAHAFMDDKGYDYYKQQINHTIDGGVTWTTVYSDTVFVDTLHPSKNGLITTINFVDKLNGYATCMKGAILKTTDGGKHWDRVASLPYKDLICNDIVFDKALHTGYIVAYRLDRDLYMDHSYIYKTKDGGKTWSLDLDLGTNPESGNGFLQSYFSKIVDDVLYLSSYHGLYKIEGITLGIPNNSKQDNIAVYPNPLTANGILSLEQMDTNGNSDFQVSLMDITGRVIQEFQFNSQIQTVALNNIVAGIYNLVMKEISTGEVTVKKLVVVD